MDLTLKERIANVTNFTKGRKKKIEYGVIHYTANDGDTDEGNGAYFANNKVKASANWFVDEDSATHSVLESNTAWQCGGGLQGDNGHTYFGKCTNSNSIGIEMCSDKVNGQFVITEKTIENTIELTRYLMDKYNIPLSNIIRHYDVTGKICPEPFVVDESKWIEFKRRLAATDPKRQADANKMVLAIMAELALVDAQGLLSDLTYYYKGSSWYVIEKLLKLPANGKKAINGHKDIYRRTLTAVEVTEKGKYNSELINIGQDSIFWVIKRLLDKRGIE